MKIYGINGNKNLIGPQIKAWRNSRRLSQAQLAAQLQLKGIMIDQKAISRIELGHRIVTDYELWAISRLLGVTADELLTVSDQAPTN